MTLGTPRRIFPALGVPLLIHLAVKLVQLAMLVLLMPADRSLASQLVAWDGGFFVRMARDGYQPHPTFGPGNGNEYAFFPLYPWLVRAVASVTPLSYEAAALVVAWVSAAAAAVLLSLLGTRLWSEWVGWMLAALFSAQPMSIVLSMGYTEATFVALVAASLLAAYTRHWIVAGVCGAAAGLTRPTGAALGVALAVAAALYMWRERRFLTPAIGAAMALVAVPGYVLWAGWKMGRLDGYFENQRLGWGTSWDWFSATGHFLLDAFLRGDGWVQISCALIIVGAVVSAVVAAGMRVWPPLLVYGAIVLTMAIGSSGYYHSRPRLLVPVLVTLVPIAIGLGRVKPRTALCVLLAWVLFGTWYGAHMLTVWKFAI